MKTLLEKLLKRYGYVHIDGLLGVQNYVHILMEEEVLESFDAKRGTYSFDGVMWVCIAYYNSTCKLIYVPLFKSIGEEDDMMFRQYLLDRGIKAIIEQDKIERNG
jgi:hypothetical protein